MAYILEKRVGSGEWEGPFPNARGEFCGNEHPSAPNFRAAEGNWDRDCYAGRPGATEEFTSEQWADKGYVGLYLLLDLITITHWTIIDTDVLQEPVVCGEREPKNPFQIKAENAKEREPSPDSQS